MNRQFGSFKVRTVSTLVTQHFPYLSQPAQDSRTRSTRFSSCQIPAGQAVYLVLNGVEAVLPRIPVATFHWTQPGQDDSEEPQLEGRVTNRLCIGNVHWIFHLPARSRCLACAFACPHILQSRRLHRSHSVGAPVGIQVILEVCGSIIYSCFRHFDLLVFGHSRF